MTARARVCVETPLAGDYTTNVRYARACMFHSLNCGEAPFLGHLLYPQVLNDTVPEDRFRGITAHLAWLAAAERVVLYIDRGVSSGMRAAVERARALGLPVETRALGADWLEQFELRTTPGAHD